MKGHGDTGMHPSHAETLKKYRVALVRDLDAEEVIDNLFSEGILTETHIDVINNITSRAKQVGKLLNILTRRGQNAFPAFLRALETTYPHLYNMLTGTQDASMEDTLYFMDGYDIMKASNIIDSKTNDDKDNNDNSVDNEQDEYISAIGMSITTRDNCDSQPLEVTTPGAAATTVVVLETCQVEEIKRKFATFDNVKNTERQDSCDDLLYSNTDADENSEEVPLKETKVGLHKGELLFISRSITLEDSSYLAVSDRVSRLLKVPKANLRFHGDPRGMPWFYPIPISPRQATMIISKHNKPGCFLVYSPPNVKTGSTILYFLSVCLNSGQVSTYHINRDANEELYLTGQRKFFTIHDLIDYYKQNRGSLKCRLRGCPKELVNPADPTGMFAASELIDPNLLQQDDTSDALLLGKGFFGQVKKFRFQGECVAIKTPINKEDEDSPWIVEDFYEEARLNSALHHPNIVRFIGISNDASNPLIVHEFIVRGDLKRCLSDDFYELTDTKTLLELCIQILSALSYLRGKKYILHRDIAARNCLVQVNATVKLCDFGLARQVIEDDYLAESKEPISVRWASPEILNSLHFSTASDIWAAGVLFWEIFTGGALPYGGLDNTQVTDKVTSRGRLGKPDSCPEDVFRVLELCWMWEISKRPSADVLLQRLQKMRYLNSVMDRED